MTRLEKKLTTFANRAARIDLRLLKLQDTLCDTLENIGAEAANLHDDINSLKYDLMDKRDEEKEK